MNKTYAIGDVHGHVVELELALDWIVEDSRGEPATVIFLGDYVDRGPDSARVVERLVQGPREREKHLTWMPLKGNHEDMMLNAIINQTQSAMNMWLSNGGFQTTESYERFPGGKVPLSHVDWMASLPLTHRVGDLLFVHAGVNFNAPLEEQHRDTMLWVRQPYRGLPLRDRAGTPLTVVVGHTPVKQPRYSPGGMLMIDTGVCFEGYDDLCVAAWDDPAQHPRVALIGHHGLFEGDRPTFEINEKGWDHDKRRWVGKRWLNE